MRLSDSVTTIPLVGPQAARRLSRLTIATVSDLLWHVPSRYEDLRRIALIKDAPVGEKVTIEGTVLLIKNTRTRNGWWLTKAMVTDGSATLEAVWFNQPYLTQTMKANQEISLAGTVDVDQGKLIMRVPEHESKGQRLHTGRLVPIYPETAGVSSKWLRSRIFWLLSHIDFEDWMPPSWQTQYTVPPLPDAFTMIHFPDTPPTLAQAARRLAIEELMIPTLRATIRRAAWDRQTHAPIITAAAHSDRIDAFTKTLPFTLTISQKHAVKKILADIQRSRPMNRLLQGDVGSGKTVVAAIGLLASIEQGLDGVIMAPTEILAVQHNHTLSTLFKPFDISVVLLTGGVRTFTKLDHPAVYVGTHALIGKRLQALSAGLVVIDEQHRFGVAQRALLRAKTANPHVLTMTATPIPRTVALTLYGDLDVTAMDTLPSGRKPIKTILVPKAKRDAAYGFIRKEIEDGKQVFIICPFIEPSETMQTVKAALAECERLATDVFPSLAVGLLHGKLSSKDKNAALENFRNGTIKLLVATPVVEVGIDVPNATIIVIEGAERFGLAQLHQLRGRVGRGTHRSYCLLFSEATGSAWRRLKALERLTSGRQLAELDLRLRGPGEVYGLAQHGVTDFKVANLSDTALVGEVGEIVERVMGNNHIQKHSSFPPVYSELVDPN